MHMPPCAAIRERIYESCRSYETPAKMVEVPC